MGYVFEILVLFAVLWGRFLSSPPSLVEKKEKETSG